MRVRRNPKEFERMVTRLFNKMKNERAGVIVPWLRVPGAMIKGQTSVLSTHIRRPTIACNSSAKRFDTLFWPLQA